MRPVAWLAVGLIFATCGQRTAATDVGGTVSSTLPSTAVVDTGTNGPRIPAVLDGFPIATVRVAGEGMLVAVADTGPRRRQGLMEVTDLGDLDGMLFSFDEAVQRTFDMGNTLIALDIAFFDEQGDLVGLLEMVPCTSDPCAVYSAPAPFQWALEAPAGSLTGLGSGDRLEVSDSG